MRHLLVALFLGLLAIAPSSPAAELIVVSGGPALRFFEKDKASSHDKYWGNFIDAARIRIQQLQALLQPGDEITWLVYRPSYEHRSEEMETELLPEIVKDANTLGVKLLWFDTKMQLINYLNKGSDRKTNPIATFDYFGHSNKACWLFDYSNEFDALSREFLHARDFSLIHHDIFASGATCKSWGCHSGEYYSAVWKKYFGVPLEGAIGKTDYSHGGLPFLSSKDGHWTE